MALSRALREKTTCKDSAAAALRWRKQPIGTPCPTPRPGPNVNDQKTGAR